MSDASKYNSFSAADIERYHSGQMSAAEKHALEKAALDDPFLADALEGYAFTATPVADVNNLKQRLGEKIQDKKIIPFTSKKFNWLQIAALFLILAGSGWLVYKTGLFSNKEIAVANPVPQKQKESTITKDEADTVSLQSKKIDAAEQADLRQEKPVIASSKPPVQSNQKRITKSTETNETELEDLADAPAIISTDAPPSEAGSLKKARTSNAAVSSTEMAAGSNNRALVQKNNSFSAPNLDSSSNAIASQNKTQSLPASNDTIKNFNVVMQPTNEKLDEVVVVGYGARKKASVKPAAKFEEPEPIEGWGNFNEYIASQLKDPGEAKQKPASGDVELSFEVNKNGEAVNIKVEKSLCSSCDEEAIRLLKEGPKWKKKKDKKGKIIIHF